MDVIIGESYIKAIENYDCLEKIFQKISELKKKNLEYVKEYKTAEAKIIGIEKVPYYVQPYTPKHEKTEYLQVYERHGRSLSFNKAKAEKKAAREAK